MARRKRNSSTLEKAERRLESLLSIHPNLDLGNGQTVVGFSALINDLANKLAIYNTALSSVDKMADDVRVAEKAVKVMAEQMLLGVGSCYGRNSQEYEMAGGSRRKGTSATKSTMATAQTTTTAASEPDPTGDPSMNGADPAPATA